MSEIHAEILGRIEGKVDTLGDDVKALTTVVIGGIDGEVGIVYISAASAIVVVLVVGLPMAIAWVKRNTWKRAVTLAAEGEHIDGAVALAASVDPAIDKARKQVDEWLETYHKRGVGAESSEEAQTAWNEARMQLVKLGVLKPGDK